MSSVDRVPAAPLPTARNVSGIVALLERCADRLDPADATDRITLLDHSLQCAALLRCAMPDDVELQVAGLVHDIGHMLMPDEADDGHAHDGAAFVRPVLGQAVAALVAMHVPAKRWLVTVDPSYRRRLSASSSRALPHQGGMMTTRERELFEASPFRRRAVALRRADETARTPGLRVSGLERWLEMLDLLAAEARHAA